MPHTFANKVWLELGLISKSTRNSDGPNGLHNCLNRVGIGYVPKFNQGAIAVQDFEASTFAKNNYKCVSCGKSFTQSVHLNSLIKVTHEGQRNYKCDSCGKSFTTSVNLKKHIKNRRKSEGTLQKIIENLKEEKKTLGIITKLRKCWLHDNI